ncbi:MAG: DNA alkylation repair protein [Deltaproteobacteria bacterium]|nr:MAG: DNA alkylation repair protein [Deltaproteobacteria bacterium]
MSDAGRDLLHTVRARLQAAGDPERAAQQQAYLKSEMPNHGVSNAEVKRLCREVFAPLSLTEPALWRGWIATLWDEATHREERYAALHLAADPRARPLRGLPRTARARPPEDAERRAADALDLYERLVVSGAWWDLVDELAVHHVGTLLPAHPERVTERLRAWIASDDLWLRRSAIIAQLQRGEDTDLALLADAIEPALASRTFWLRKAIGWALRQYARTDPAWVRAFVDRAGDRMSGLSRREALKHLG